MYQLMEYLDKLKLSINNCNIITNLEKYRKVIYKNKYLMNLIKEYNNTKNSNIKFEIYKNKEFAKYKECETNVNLLIMEINNKLKKLYHSGG